MQRSTRCEVLSLGSLTCGAPRAVAVRFRTPSSAASRCASVTVTSGSDLSALSAFPAGHSSKVIILDLLKPR